MPVVLLQFYAISTVALQGYRADDGCHPIKTNSDPQKNDYKRYSTQEVKLNNFTESSLDPLIYNQQGVESRLHINKSPS